MQIRNHFKKVGRWHRNSRRSYLKLVLSWLCSMSRHQYGLLLSQLLDCIARPLEEEQVWAICYKICRSSLDLPGRDSDASNATGVTFAVETIYLGKNGEVSLIFNNSLLKMHEVSQGDISKQMKDLSQVLFRCLENGSPNQFLQRQVGNDLDVLMHSLAQGVLMEEKVGNRWLEHVADFCARHAVLQTLTPVPEYYCSVCQLLVNEAMVMNNFLAVVLNEVSRSGSREDAFSTFQLSQARPVISNWLLCMSEIRDDTVQKYNAALRKSFFPRNVQPTVHPSPQDISHCALYPYPPRMNTPLPKISEESEISDSKVLFPKPTCHSTPSVASKTTRKVLRPPQRLVNQVTTWILENKPLLANENDFEDSWFSGKRHGQVLSTLGWLGETKRIRRVLTELQIDTAMDDSGLYEALRGGEICFCCRRVKFSLFNRSGVNCEVCERKICGKCMTRMTAGDLGMSSRDLEMSSRDIGMSSRDSGLCTRDIDSGSRDELEDENLLMHIRRILTPKRNSSEKVLNLCKDCRDFIQRYY